MDYLISVSESGRYIILIVRGNINRRFAVEMNAEAHSLGRSLGINNYFVDLTDAVNSDDAVGHYEFAYEDMQHVERMDMSAHVATLVAPDDHSHDFIETVSRNAGLDLTFFRDREAAIRHVDIEPSSTA